MGEFRLKIRFTGMWVYVPVLPIKEDHQVGNELRVVAVETRDREIIPNSPEWHHPFLLAEQGNVTKKGNWPPGRLKVNDQASLYAFQLDGRTLSVSRAMRYGLTFRLADAQDPCPTSKETERDFHWLLQMDSSHPGKGKVDRYCLVRPQMRRLRVAAQVYLTEGDFSTLYVSRDCEGQIIRWKVDKDGTSRALAEMMELQVMIQGDHVWLSDELWGPRPTHTPNAIRLSPKTEGEDVVVVFKNMPLEYLWVMRPRLTKAEKIEHFHSLARVFDKEVNLRDPVPDDDRCRYYQSELTFDPCPPVSKVNDPQCPGLGADPGP